MRLRNAGAFAIALSIAIAGFPGATTATAFAQSPEPATGSQNALAVPSGAVTAAPHPAAASSPASLNTSAAATPPDAHTVISYLSDVIKWYEHLGVEAQLVRDPDETLFFTDDRQVAGEVMRLAFDYAHKQAKFIARTNSNAGAAAGSAGSSADAAGLGSITQTYKALDAAAGVLRARIQDLQARLAKAPARQRAAIASEIQESQSELDLKQERVNTLKALAQFKSGSSSPDQSGGLAAQIDELEHSISDSNAKRPPVLPAESTFVASAEPTGLFGVITELIALSNKLDALDQNSALAQALAARATGVRQSTINLIAGLNARANALSQGTAAADIAALKDRTKSFESLLEEYQLARDAALPLSKQIVLLGIYTNNVGRWHAAIEQRWNKEFRSLVIRMIGLGVAFALIFLGAMAWRWITNRYVTDVRRRGQVMAARRLVLGLIVLIVVLINFASEIGSAATIVGFAAAGIAVALQNVILSIAGYFFLIGRFGIKAGDRVQIGGVTGDVIDIGLVKLSLMELGGTGTHREPTGRVAVFSNAIVFQPSGNFFKQAPGTSFVWNEVRLTLAPDIDYRLAEKRLLEVVDEVFARYRDRVMRDYRHLERDLNIVLETPKPQSRLHLSKTGLEIVIRYPAETYSAPQITDEISRRVLDAINREPSLRMAPQGTANIESQLPAPATADTENENGTDKPAGDTPDAAAAGEKAARATPPQK
ncbi:MAG: mechanosensitive ion channel family protein [Candidatus Binatus sp.]|uniref:mechanosensitive ion channel family protein n=1 Tax=Candidatus Binatus sp. TaxID=2811406 RepID=UPI003C766598